MEQKVEYKIVVTKVEKDVPYISKDYVVVSDVETPGNDGRDARRDRKYDYVETEKLKDVDTKVYEQVVDQLDLGGLAVFINTREKAAAVAKGSFDGSQQTQD